MMRYPPVFSTAVLALLSCLPLTPVSADPRPVVVELFTSQGCSSCPPADQLLGELAGRPDVLALAYHVDYWDYLGWKDKFALSAATARQQAYGRSLGLRGIYTPQMVVDGRQDLVGSDRARVTAALSPSADGIGIRVNRTEEGLRIDIAAASLKRPADIMLVAYSTSADTRVARGENAGRLLREFAIVRSMQRLAAWDGSARQFALPRTALPDDADRVAILVQETGTGPVLGAASAVLRD